MVDEDRIDDLLDGDPLLKTDEVAALFRVDAKTVAKWAEDERVPALKLPGGREWRFRESVVRRHLTGVREKGEADVE